MRVTLAAILVMAAACAQPKPEIGSTDELDTAIDCGGYGGGGGGGGGGGFADVLLTHANADLVQTTSTSWSLTKTGEVNTSADAITWTITSTEGATGDRTLTVDGDLGLYNIGTGSATLGNIVVNLQLRDHWGFWQTAVSDIADATHDVNATFANVVAIENDELRAHFETGSASGKLYFMDRETNAVFALVPEKTLPPHSDTPLLFSATFDNNILKLADHTDVRVEVIVTFGNHAAGPPWLDGYNIDINGNGVIDPDEHVVRSVPNIWSRDVPKAIAANQTIAVSDDASDVTTMGTVTLSNELFALPTTVTTDYLPGPLGGSVTNCAHASGSGVVDQVGSNSYTVVPPVSLVACDTENIAQPTCTPGTGTCGWHDDDLFTYGQAEWGDDNPTPTDASGLLVDEFNAEFPSSLQIGLPSGFTETFGTAQDVINYLPATGTANPLDGNYIDPPTSGHAGAFGGQVLALDLNITFADAGLLPPSTSGLKLGDLTLCHFDTVGVGSGAAGEFTQLDGMSVRNFYALVNTLLSGGTGSYPVTDDLNSVVGGVNMAFDDGAVSTFAQQHLVSGACM